MNRFINKNAMITILISIFILTGFFIVKLYIQNRESEEISRLFITILAPQLAVFIGIFALLKEVKITDSIPLKCQYHSETLVPFEMIVFSSQIQNNPSKLVISPGLALNYSLYLQEYQRNKWIPDTIEEPIDFSTNVYFEIITRKIVDDIVKLSHNQWNDLNRMIGSADKHNRTILDNQFSDFELFKILFEGPPDFVVPKNTEIDVKIDKKFKTAVIKFENKYSSLLIKLLFKSSGFGLGEIGLLNKVDPIIAQEKYITTDFEIVVDGKINKYYSHHPNSKYYKSWIDRTITNFKRYDFNKIFEKEKELAIIKGIAELTENK